MTALTALMKALPALARAVSGSAAPAGPAPAPGPDPVELTDAQLDRVAGGRDDAQDHAEPTVAALRRSRAATSGGISLLATLWLLSGCASGETLFRSDFDESVGTVPKGSNGAAVGTVASDPNSTNHVVVLPTSPPGGSVRIARQRDGDVPPPTSSFQCLFAQPTGDGTSVFSARLSISGVSGPISIQFEPANTPVTELGSSFLHLDLMPDNTIRIDDNDATKFGTFPRGDEFLLQVILRINAALSANIAVGGPGASGGSDYQIQPPFVQLARQYGAVRLWLGAQTFTGPIGVFVKDVLVQAEE